ncbi:invasin domain 3-containing protein [Cellulomonas hominis]
MKTGRTVRRRALAGAAAAALVLGVVTPASAAEGPVVLDRAFAANLGAGFDGTARVVVPLPDGTLVIGGAFTGLDGVGPAGLVRLNADGSPDAAFNTALGTGFDAQVRAVVRTADGGLVVGGAFTSLNGTTVPTGIVKLGADGTPDVGFNANLGAGLSAPGLIPDPGTFIGVEGLAATADGGVVVTGLFYELDGSDVPDHLVKLDAGGTPDPVFDANLGTGLSNTSGPVATTVTGEVLVGGGVGTLDGAPSGGLVRLNPDGTRDAAFDAALGTGFDGTTYALTATADGGVVVGGVFTTLNGTAANHLVKLDAAGTRDPVFDTNLGTGPDDYVLRITQTPTGALLVGGAFTSVDGTGANRLVRLDAVGSPDVAFNASLGAGFDGAVYTAVETADGAVLASGAFTSAVGSPAPRLARLVESAVASASITASPRRVLADGAAASVVTIRLVDGLGEPVTDEHAVVLELTGEDGLVPGPAPVPVSQGDGNWTAELRSSVPGAVQVRFGVDHQPVDPALVARVEFVDPAVLTASTLVASPDVVVADGSASSIVTVVLLDGAGDPVVGDHDVVVTTDLGDLTPVTDVGDGTYTSRLSSAQAGVATLGLEVDGWAADATAEVEFTAAAGPEVVASMVLTHAERRVGQAQGATGAGFAPGETVVVSMASDPVVLGTAVADGAGDVVFGFVVPAVADGTHTVTMTGQVSGRAASAAFQVVSDPAGGGGAGPGAGAGDGGLPVTGAAGVLGVSLLAALTTAAGLALVLVRNRRRGTGPR